MATSMAEGLRAVLHAALASDAVLLGDDVGRGGGLAGSAAGLLAAHGPDKVIDLPVADRAAVALAVGLALGGRRPVVELTATGRLPAVLEALAEAASVAADGEFAVPLVVRVPCGGEAGGRVDRPVADVLAGVPGLSVVAATASTGAALLRAALAAPHPTVILEPRSHAHLRVDPVEASLDRLRVLREGRHVSLVAWGAGVDGALRAADVLATDGIDADVIDLVSLAPIDPALGERVRRTGRLVVAHDPGDDGFARRVVRASLDAAFLYLESPPATAPHDAVVAAARASVAY